MSGSAAAREPAPRARGPFGAQLRSGLPRDRAASRIAAFVYGNILILTALIALHPRNLGELTGVAYVTGIAASTFVAHVVAQYVALRVGADTTPPLAAITRMMRDAVPIATAASVPALLMVATLLGWLDAAAALQLAIAVTVLRLSGLGLMVGRIREERASLRMIVSGLLLAAVCVAAAVLKWTLTH